MQLDVLAFGPHPDDIELTCGGTLIKLSDQGYTTGVVALTRGELGTRGSPKIRSREFRKASRLLGAKAHRILDIPDGYIRSTQENHLKIIREIRRYRPKIIFAPYWHDRHPDHERASVLIREAAFLSGLEKIKTNQDSCRPLRVIFYPCRYEFNPSFIVDVSEVHERKLEAVATYESQFNNTDNSSCGKTTNIASPEFMESVIARAKQYGSYIGTTYGEPFLVREPIRIDNPIDFFDEMYIKSFV